MKIHLKGRRQQRRRALELFATFMNGNLYDYIKVAFGSFVSTSRETPPFKIFGTWIVAIRSISRRGYAVKIHLKGRRQQRRRALELFATFMNGNLYDYIKVAFGSFVSTSRETPPFKIFGTWIVAIRSISRRGYAVKIHLKGRRQRRLRLVETTGTPQEFVLKIFESSCPAPLFHNTAELLGFTISNAHSHLTMLAV